MRKLLFFHASWCPPCRFYEKQFIIPVGKTEFYAIRRLFYHYLDKMQTGTKWGCSNDTMMSSGKRKAAS